MKIDQILSTRNLPNYNYWDIVTEWEDELAKQLQIPIKNKNPRFKKIFEVIPYSYKLLADTNTFVFQLSTGVLDNKYSVFQYLFNLRGKNISKVIPCIIDFWLTKDKIKTFDRLYSNNKVVLISSLEALYFLKRNGCTLKNIHHWPLSLPDKYKIKEEYMNNKKCDLIFIGRRQNEQLLAYLKEYQKEYPDFTYASRKIENGHINYYTNKNEFIGCSDTREGYFNVIRKARCAFYATPELSGREDTNGFNQVTPRFLEILSGACHVIARYPKNEDTDFYEMEKICKSISSYEEFKQKMNMARTTPIDFNLYSSYLEKHYTSARVDMLNKILKEY